MAETISQTQEGLERQVQERTAQLRESEESLPPAVCRQPGDHAADRPSPAATIIAANAAAVEFYGYPAERLVGTAHRGDQHPAARADHGVASLPSSKAAGAASSSSTAWPMAAFATSRSMRRSFVTGRGRCAIRLSTTSRTASACEAARLQAERLRRSLLDNSAVGIFCGSPDRTILEANVRACAMFGYTPEEMQGQSFRLIHLSEEHFQNFAPQYASLKESRICKHRFPFPAQGREHSVVLGLRDPVG